MLLGKPGQGRYARDEREQRWLLRVVPPGLIDPRDISDRYVIGTSLRLRRVAEPTDLVLKLSQKARVDPTSPERVRLTNIYLAPEEYHVLLALPATELRKTRWQSDLTGRPTAIDVFHGELAGLVLAEVELDEGGDRLPPPEGAALDVTHDDRFSGAELSRCSAAGLHFILEELLGP